METFYGEGPHHELYTAFAGLYFCWLVLRGAHVFSSLVPRGWSNCFNRIKSYTVLVSDCCLNHKFSFFSFFKFFQVSKCTIAFSLLLGVIPLLFGLLLDLVIVVPLRVAVNQSPIFSLSQVCTSHLQLNKESSQFRVGFVGLELGCSLHENRLRINDDVARLVAEAVLGKGKGFEFKLSRDKFITL